MVRTADKIRACRLCKGPFKSRNKSQNFCSRRCGWDDKRKSAEVIAAGKRERQKKRYHEGKSILTDRLYIRWSGMKSRCRSPKCKAYPLYGGRGIKLCSEWDDWNVFKKWALENGYSKELTIDRIDNDGHYEPSNCRWTDWKTQSRNKRNTKRVVYKGELVVLADLVEAKGLNYYTVLGRLQMGWEADRAIDTPLKNLRALKEV